MSSIRYKQDALKKYRNQNVSDMMLFCEDLSSNGAKTFYVTKPKVIYDKICNDRIASTHMYEFWDNDSKILFGLDMDNNKSTSYDKALESVKSNIIKVCNAAEKYYGYKYDIEDIVVLESDHQISINESKKYSFHVIFRGLVFQNHLVCKDFFMQANTDYNLEYSDPSIYNMTCLRLCYNTKLGKTAKLLPIELTIKGKNTLTDIKTNLDHYQFFLKTMITHISQQDSGYVSKNKMFKKIVEEEQEPLNINKTEIENINVETILFELPYHICEDFNSWNMVGSALCNASKHDPALNLEMFRLWDRWSAQCEEKYKKGNIRNYEYYWRTTCAHSPITMGYIINLCKQFGIGNIFKNSKLTMQQIVKDYPARPIELNTAKNTLTIEQKKLNSEIFLPYLDKKLLCIQSEKGTGKTTNLLKVLFDEQQLIKEDTSVLFVSSRRTFGAKLLGDLKQYGFVLYSEIKSYDIYDNKVICQIDSLTRLNVNMFDYVIIDECESCARYITSKHFTKNPKANIIVSSLEQRISEASRVVIMDADLSNRCLEYYINTINLTDDDYQIIVNTYKPFKEYTLLTMFYDDWVQKLLTDIGNNKRIAVPMASNNKAKDLKTKIEMDYPDLKVLLIHKETKDEDKVKQLMNVNETWKAYDVVIYTPSVCMGVSFDIPKYFDSIYAYGCDHSLGAQEFCQMIHRVREPINKVINLSLNTYKEFDPYEDILTFNQVEEILCSDYYLTHYELHQPLIKTKITRDDKTDDKILVYPYKNEPIYRLFIHNSLEYILNVLNFGASLYGYAKDKQYDIEFFRYDLDSKDHSIKNDMKNIKDIRVNNDNETCVQGIIEAPDITKDEFKELVTRKDDHLSVEDLQKINRYKFRECYNIQDELTFELVDEYNNKDKMKWYHNLTNILDTDQQKTIEKLEILKNNVVRDKWLNTCYMDFTSKCNYSYQLYAYNTIATAGFDINNLNVVLNQIDLNNNIKNCMAYIDSNKENIAYKFGVKIYNKNIIDIEVKEQLKLVNNIISNFYGLRIKRITGYNKNQTDEKIFYKLTDNKVWEDLPREQKVIPVDLKATEDYLSFKDRENSIAFLLNDWSDDESVVDE